LQSAIYYYQLIAPNFPPPSSFGGLGAAHFGDRAFFYQSVTFDASYLMGFPRFIYHSIKITQSLLFTAVPWFKITGFS